MNKTLYYVGNVFEIIFLLMVLCLMPFIIETKIEGILFVFVIVLFVTVRLAILIAKKQVLIEFVSHNILMIALACYLMIIFIKVFLISGSTYLLYDINIDYCRNNFLLISVVMFCMTMNTILLTFTGKRVTRM